MSQWSVCTVLKKCASCFCKLSVPSSTCCLSYGRFRIRRDFCPSDLLDRRISKARGFCSASHLVLKWCPLCWTRPRIPRMVRNFCPLLFYYFYSIRFCPPPFKVIFLGFDQLLFSFHSVLDLDKRIVSLRVLSFILFFLISVSFL